MKLKNNIDSSFKSMLMNQIGNLDWVIKLFPEFNKANY